MAEQRVSRERVDALARKLGGFESELSGEERDLLMTVFGMAASAMGTAAEDAEVSGYGLGAGLSPSPPAIVPSFGGASLSSGFQSAFFPGPAGQFRFGAGDPSSRAIIIEIGQ